MAIHVFNGGGAGNGGAIPRGVHTTSGDTIAYYQPTAQHNTLLVDNGAGTYDFTLDAGKVGWWDFGHPSGYLANIVTGSGSTNGGRLYCSAAADDDNLQPSWRNSNTATGYALTVAFSFYLFNRGADIGNGIYLCNHAVGGGFNQEYVCAVDNNGKVYVGRDTASGWDSTGLGASHGQTINSGEWHHVIYTQDSDGTAGAAWLNGVKGTFTTVVSNQADASGRSALGWEQADRGTIAIFNPIYESAECSDARAAALYAAHNIS